MVARQDALSTAWMDFSKALAETAPPELSQAKFAMMASLTHLAFERGARTVMSEVTRILELEDVEKAALEITALEGAVARAVLEGQNMSSASIVMASATKAH